SQDGQDPFTAAFRMDRTGHEPLGSLCDPSHRSAKPPQRLWRRHQVLIRAGELFSSVEYLQAQQIRRQIKQEFTAALQEVDVIIAPTLPVMAPDIGSPTAQLNGQDVDLIDAFMRYTGPSNLT